ncbi:MAG TPA: aconitate hydratase AcnA [Thermoplasmata archaeon]|nr:aconitate hydratase AcnA [Thermoplasmata archaeon]
MNRPDPLGARATLDSSGESSTIYRVDRVPGVEAARLARRPLTVRILLENLVRNYDSRLLDASLITRLANTGDGGTHELPFYPGRVLLQDFTGVPALVDLTAIRAAAERRGVPPEGVDPEVPVDLIVDHSVQVDSFGSPRSLSINLDREYERNGERYDFLRWSRQAYRHMRIVPPGNGICHQVNLEYLASVVDRRTDPSGAAVAFPDTLVGTDSHTTMVNGLGVLGWGVGGIEAEAVMLGEPYFLPPVDIVGVRLTGRLPDGSTATDIVLAVTHALRQKGVVEKFVEFFGPGLELLSVQDRATISNMCPEYGATAALFPMDAATIRYLQGTGRPGPVVQRVEAYARATGLWRDEATPEPEYPDVLEIDLGTIRPTVSGPKNPAQSVALSEVPASFRASLSEYRASHARPASAGADSVPDGAVAIAAITSCTNTSNPTVMVGAGLMARRASELGLTVPKWVKTSLAPGSKVVTSYLERAGLLAPLDALGFALVGYGCTTCIGNAGPLPPDVARAVEERDAFVVAVLSGNRNFEGRIHNQVRGSYLTSPMLVVAYALAGKMDVDISHDPLGKGKDGRPVYLRDLWPAPDEVRAVVESTVDAGLFREKYRSITEGDPHWEGLPTRSGPSFPWDRQSTYLREPPYLQLPPPAPVEHGVLLEGARALAVLGDQVSTDHISPAGNIPVDSPAGRYLLEHGVAPAEFNSYGTRRGNHEVMVRGTFANVRLKNQLAGGKEGGFTTVLPEGTSATIYDAAMAYQARGTPLVVLAGKDYGQGSSRDWAAKGPLLLGVRAVLARNFERIHRGNLVGMGVLPLEFPPAKGVAELGLTGRETFRIATAGAAPLTVRAPVNVTATPDSGPPISFPARCRVDSPVELEYLARGGLLPYVLDRVVARAGRP